MSLVTSNSGKDTDTIDDRARSISQTCSGRPVERHHRRARMVGAAGGSAGSAHEPDAAVDSRPCCDDSDAARGGG